MGNTNKSRETNKAKLKDVIEKPMDLHSSLQLIKISFSLPMIWPLKRAECWQRSTKLQGN